MKKQKQTLSQVMADNNDLATDDQLVRRANSPAITEPVNRDAPAPEVSDACVAMLIMADLTATWNYGFWVIRSRNGGRCHVSARNDFHEWRGCVNMLSTGAKFIGE